MSLDSVPFLFSETSEGERGTLSGRLTASDVGFPSLSVEEKTVYKKKSHQIFAEPPERVFCC